jgi:uncharacterized protein involved in exopolysaccharide biosynthesis
MPTTLSQPLPVCSGEISGAVGERPDLIGAFMADDRTVHRTIVDRFRLLWEERRFLLRVTALGCLLATTIAFLIPRQFEAITELMPPDRDAGSGLASLLAMTRPDGGLGGLAGDLLGLKTSGALFVGILRSHTVEGRIVDQFDLKKVYGVRHRVDARRELENNTQISEDRKSGIIFMVVTDHQPERARDIAHAYVSELDRLVADLNTSSAHRERVFLETGLSPSSKTWMRPPRTSASLPARTPLLTFRNRVMPWCKRPLRCKGN